MKLALASHAIGAAHTVSAVDHAAAKQLRTVGVNPAFAGRYAAAVHALQSLTAECVTRTIELPHRQTELPIDPLTFGLHQRFGARDAFVVVFTQLTAQVEVIGTLDDSVNLTLAMDTTIVRRLAGYTPDAVWLDAFFGAREPAATDRESHHADP